MKDSKRKSTLYSILSILCFLAAFLIIIFGEFTYVIVILLGLGALFLGLGSTELKKSKGEQNDDRTQ